MKSIVLSQIMIIDMSRSKHSYDYSQLSMSVDIIVVAKKSIVIDNIIIFEL